MASTYAIDLTYTDGQFMTHRNLYKTIEEFLNPSKRPDEDLSDTIRERIEPDDDVFNISASLLSGKISSYRRYRNIEELRYTCIQMLAASKKNKGKREEKKSR